MVDFIMKYWLEFLFGLIAGGLSFLCKKFYTLYKAEKERQQTSHEKAFYESLKEAIQKVGQESLKEDTILKERIDALTVGILSVQGRIFKQGCRELLQEDREISLEEFENIQEEYEAYKLLGGNHDGDSLFEMIKRKATSNITD